jgi:hypothetical protein
MITSTAKNLSTEYMVEEEKNETVVIMFLNPTQQLRQNTDGNG